MNCKDCQTALPDLLLDPTAPSNTAARTHMADCAACAQELAALETMFSVLDSWSAPPVSPYFDQKLAVRLREEQAAPAANWLERLRARLLFNTGRQFRPALAGSLALILVLGGGGFSLSNFAHSRPAMASAAVNDLQILNRNEQALQGMDQLLQDDAAPANNAPAALPQS